MDHVGEVRVAAYRAGRHLAPGDRYEPRLRSLGADGTGDVLVAIEPTEPWRERGGVSQEYSGVLGTVMLQTWPVTGEVVQGPFEAEIRALAVRPGAQGLGVGAALLKAVIERARERSIRHLVLLTQRDMVTAQGMYERAGFVRLPDRDRPEYQLLAYGLRLEPPSEAPSDPR